MKTKMMILLFILGVVSVSFTGCSGSREICPAYSEALIEHSEDDLKNKS